MSPNHSPYVFRDEHDDADDEFEGTLGERSPTGEQEVVIVDGRAMSYRWYRR